MKVSKLRRPLSELRIGHHVSLRSADRLGVVLSKSMDGTPDVKFSCLPKRELREKLRRETCIASRLYQLVFASQSPISVHDWQCSKTLKFDLFSFRDLSEPVGEVHIKVQFSRYPGRSRSSHWSIVYVRWDGNVEYDTDA